MSTLTHGSAETAATAAPARLRPTGVRGWWRTGTDRYLTAQEDRAHAAMLAGRYGPEGVAVRRGTADSTAPSASRG